MSPPLQLTQDWIGYLALLILLLAYVAAMFEEVTALRKSTPLLLAAGVIWALIVWTYQQHGQVHDAVDMFKMNLETYAELLFFIIVSMTYLNRLDELKVFDVLRIKLLSKGLHYRQLFWVTGALVFFMSLFINGLTAGLLMGSIVMAVGKHNARFVSLACINIVVATNAGGSVSPLGGISTLFVWQHNMLKFTEFLHLLLPCLVNFIVPALFMQHAIPKEIPKVEIENIHFQPGASGVLMLFVLTILMTVGMDMFLGMPSAFGMMSGLSLLNIYNFYLQRTAANLKTKTHQGYYFLNHDQQASVASHQHLRLSDEVCPLDWDTLLFFYGAMMGISGIGYIGYLDLVSHSLYGGLSPTVANVLIGLSSAFIDNGTLMFAILTMHPVLSAGQWLLLTLTLGVGGSLLAIGSAPGIGLQGLAKGQYTFSEHLKWCPVILLGYFASIAVHFLVNARYF